MQRRFALLLAAGLATLACGEAAARADAPAPDAVYVVTYVETVAAPSVAGAAPPPAVLARYRDASAREPGALDVEVLGDAGRPGRYVMIEEWSSPQAFSRHGGAAATQRLALDLEAWLAGPIDQRVHARFQ